MARISQNATLPNYWNLWWALIKMSQIWMSEYMRNDTIAICLRGKISELRLSQEWTKWKAGLLMTSWFTWKRSTVYLVITILIKLFCSNKIHDHSLQCFDWPQRTHLKKQLHKWKNKSNPWTTGLLIIQLEDSGKTHMTWCYYQICNETDFLKNSKMKRWKRRVS